MMWIRIWRAGQSHAQWGMQLTNTCQFCHWIKLRTQEWYTDERLKVRLLLLLLCHAPEIGTAVPSAFRVEVKDYQWILIFGRLCSQCSTWFHQAWKIDGIKQLVAARCKSSLHACHRLLFERGLSIDSRAYVINQHARWPIRTPEWWSSLGGQVWIVFTQLLLGLNTNASS